MEHVFPSTGSFTLTIADSITKDPLPYANVLIESKRAGTYTDKFGVADLNFENLDILIISYVGYKTKKVIASTIVSDTIFLTPVVPELAEVSITSKRKLKSVKLNYQKNKDGGLKGVTSAVRLIVTDFEDFFVKSVNLRLHNTYFTSESTEIFKRLPVVIKLLVLENFAGKPGKSLLTEEYIMTVNSNKQIAKFELDNLFISSDSFFIGLEFIGYFEGEAFIPYTNTSEKILNQFCSAYSIDEGVQFSWTKNGFKSEWTKMTWGNRTRNFSFGVELMY